MFLLERKRENLFPRFFKQCTILPLPRKYLLLRCKAEQFRTTGRKDSYVNGRSSKQYEERGIWITGKPIPARTTQFMITAIKNFSFFFVYELSKKCEIIENNKVLKVSSIVFKKKLKYCILDLHFQRPKRNRKRNIIL